MIKLYIQNEKVFVWNSDDAYKIRTLHHIVGSLTGCFPRQAFQNNHKWLPLQLLPEEAKLLTEKSVAEIVSNPVVGIEPPQQSVQQYWENRKRCCEEQIAKMKENRAKIISEKAEQILKGKRSKQLEGFEHKNVLKKKKKRLRMGMDQAACDETSDSLTIKAPEEMEQDTFDDDDDDDDDLTSPLVMDLSEHDDMSSSVVSEDTKSSETSSSSSTNRLDEADSAKTQMVKEEVSRMSNNLTDGNCLVQLFTECSWKSENDNVPVSLPFPRTALDKVRYAVFKDLWERGYYLTTGMKFGGDYLAYAGDPMEYHALFIVICIESDRNFNAKDLITYGRLGNQVKKTVVLSSLLPDNTVDYLLLSWASDIVVCSKRN